MRWLTAEEPARIEGQSELQKGMELQFEDRESWRTWLQENHATAGVVWLVFNKKHTGKRCISYDESVEEALCFGWIDSLVKRLDDERFARKFTPRKNASKWSASNLERMRKLIANGRMTEAGLALYDPDTLPHPPPAAAILETPPFVTNALEKHPKARAFFDGLAPSYRRAYVGWIISAKREETRKRRLEEAIDLLSQGKKLGMK